MEQSHARGRAWKAGVEWEGEIAFAVAVTSGGVSASQSQGQCRIPQAYRVTGRTDTILVMSHSARGVAETAGTANGVNGRHCSDLPMLVSGIQTCGRVQPAKAFRVTSDRIACLHSGSDNLQYIPLQPSWHLSQRLCAQVGWHPVRALAQQWHRSGRASLLSARSASFGAVLCIGLRANLPPDHALKANPPATDMTRTARVILGIMLASTMAGARPVRTGHLRFGFLYLAFQATHGTVHAGRSSHSPGSRSGHAQAYSPRCQQSQHQDLQLC